MTQECLAGTSCMSVLNFLSVIIASHTGYHAQGNSIDLDVARAVLMLVMNEILFIWSYQMSYGNVMLSKKTLFTRLFLAGRCMWARRKTNSTLKFGTTPRSS